VGLFFSLGVDSFYSLLKNNRDHPSDEKTIDDLLFVRGLDIAIDDPKVDDLFGMSVLNAKRVADQFARSYSLPRQIFVILLTDSSIGQDLSRRGAREYRARTWRRITEVNIASTYDWEHLFPWGSHPKLDPLWSMDVVIVSRWL